MNITLDITKKFNTLVNYDYFFDGPPMNPVIFLNFPDKINGVYEFQLMNFGLNLSDDMNKAFIENSPYFDDIVQCTYQYRRIIVYGKAKFKFTGIKGADIKFADQEAPLNGQKVYRSWSYKVEKDDYDFICGGYSSFSPHFTTIQLIGDATAMATITFSSEDYFLIDSEKEGLEDFASSKQALYNYMDTERKKLPSNCSTVAGKMFNYEFVNKYFQTVYKEGFHTTVAIESEK